MMRTARMLGILIQHEMRTLARERTFLLLLGLFFAMTFFSVYIGWATRATTFAIYDSTAALLHSSGVANVRPNPLIGVSPLAVFDNMIVYILLVGALLAIVIGHRSFMRERRSGVIPLVFVRPLSKGEYLAGKLLGIALALAVIMLLTFIVSAVSALLIPALHLSTTELIRLGGFYALSFLYLSFFAIAGLLAAILLSSESIALFAPIMLWIGLVFILPELSTGQNPVALLNPITLSQATPSPAPFFVLMRAVLAPFSVGQYYTGGALAILKVNSGIPFSSMQLIADAGGSIVGLIAYLALLCGAAQAAMRSYAIASDALL